MVHTKRISLFIAGLLLLAAPLAQATVFEAVGIAPIGAGGIEQARVAAIRDATRQASVQAGAELEMSESTTRAGVPLQSSRIRPPREFASVTVVREWREGDLLHVLIRADDKALREAGGVPRAYKKKVVATQFTVNVPRQLDDVDDIYNGFPRELMQRLQATNAILPRMVQRPIFADIEQMHTDAGRMAVRQVAEQNDAQFVVTGQVLDTGSAKDGGYWGFFRKSQRRFEVDVFVHDGLTGALVGHHRLLKIAEGNMSVGRDKPFGSARFNETEYGSQIASAIDEAAQMILTDLSRLPFAARIVKVADAKIFLDAGTTSAISSGDTMVVYQLRDDWSVNGLRGQSDIGVPEVPLTTVVITQVQPLFSSGEIQGDPKALKVKVGDLVRFEAGNRRE